MTRPTFRAHHRVFRRSRAAAILRGAVEGLESRLLLSASVDPDFTFGVNGRVIDGPPTALTDLRDAALQSDGRIVTVAGNRLARYAPDGAPDPTFGAGGATTLARGAAAFAVRGDNKIVVAEYDPADANRLILARYTATGQVDTTFGGGDGEVSQPFFGGATTSNKLIARLLVQPATNRIYVAGTALRETYDFALAAFNEDGSRYDFFGNDGQYTTLQDFGHADFLNDATLAPNGDVVAVGSWTVSDSHHPFYAGDYAVVRWDQSGIPVPSFAGTGHTTVQFGAGQDPDSLFDSAQSVAVDPAGNIVVAGRSYDPQNPTPFRTSVARLKPDGALDATFNPGGPEGDGRALLYDMAPNFYATNSVAVLPSGGVLIGTAAPGSPGFDAPDFRLIWLNAAGNTAAYDTRDLGANDFPSRLLVQSGKPLLIGGTGTADSPPAPNSTRLAMARYVLTSSFNQQPTPLTGPLEFENFDDGGEGVSYHDTDAVNQGGAYRTNTGVDIQPVPTGGNTLAFAKAGEWTAYTVTVPQDGTYDVDVRLASLKGGGKFHLEVDGRPVGPTATVPGTGDWQKYANVRVSGAPLVGGIHVLRLVMDANDPTGYVANFDRALFTRRPDAPSTPFGGKAFATPGFLQFENYDEGGEGVAYHDAEPANLGGAYRNAGADVQGIPPASGGGYALAFAKAGEWTQYTFTVPPESAGRYDLIPHVAAARGGGAFDISIDGASISPPITIGGTGTGDWQKYGDVFPRFDFTLAAGTHVLRLTQLTNGGYGYVANFDYIWFQRYREPYYSEAFLPGTTIQAEDYDIGGEGVTYHDTEPANLGSAYRPTEGVDIEPTRDVDGGNNVGFARAGEWIEYYIGGPETDGTLLGIEARVASLRAGGRFHFEIDGRTVASFTAPATGSWQTYTTLSSPKNIRITPGGHFLRVVMDQNNSTGYVANFNWMKLTT